MHNVLWFTAFGVLVGLRLRMEWANRKPRREWRRREAQEWRRITTIQRGPTGLHLLLTLLTSGAWLLVWPLYRRTYRIRTRTEHR